MNETIYTMRGISFSSMEGGDFCINLMVSKHAGGERQVSVLGSEIQNLDFTSIVEFFRQRINSSF